MAALCFLVLLAALTADTVLQAHRFGRDLQRIGFGRCVVWTAAHESRKSKSVTRVPTQPTCGRRSPWRSVVDGRGHSSSGNGQNDQRS
jgi:hypothetical protein